MKNTIRNTQYAIRNTKIAILFTLIISCLLLPQAKALAASDWFVRPAGGNYGNEDGSSYQDAWDGLSNVVWGPGGVEAGDTLYVSGLHLRTRLDESYNDNVEITPGTNGVDGKPITIRGDYPGDPGVIWGAGIMAHESWVNEGLGVWSISLPANHYDIWFFEDITINSWTVLDKKTSLADCQATAGSYYAADYSRGSKLYVHTSDGADPTGRIAANHIGYYIYLKDNHYITFKNIDIYNNWRWATLTQSAADYTSYITWNGCTLWYAEYAVFPHRNYHHHLSIINCDIAWAGNGIYLVEYPRDETGPTDFLIQGCTIHDIGLGEQANNDAHAIGAQGLNSTIIEKNEIYNTGTGVTFYEYKDQHSCINNIVRWNYIHDTHTLGGANGRGIEFNAGNLDSAAVRSGNECYGNIVANMDGSAYKLSWANYTIPFYNNIAYNCGISFYIVLTGSPTGPIAVIKNSISLNPKKRHIHWNSGNTIPEGSYSINSDYNIFYPISGDDFYMLSKASAPLDITYAEWQALSMTDSVFDPHSMVADPMFVSANPQVPADFKLQAGSPAIDAGINVGLTKDFSGKPIPQGVAFDIGAYEYVPETGSMLYGDVSGDAEITAYDAALTAQAAVELISLTAEQTKAADVSGDGEVSAYDAALIAQRAVELIDKFPVE